MQIKFSLAHEYDLIDHESKDARKGFRTRLQGVDFDRVDWRVDWRVQVAASADTLKESHGGAVAIKQCEELLQRPLL